MSKNLNIKNLLKIKNLKFKIGLLVVLVVLVVFPQKAYAAPFSVELYPPIVQIKATPPVSLKTPLIIKNPSDLSQTFDISFRPFTQGDEENGQVRYLKDEELNLEDPLMLQRVKIYEEDLEISKVELAPKQQKQLMLVVDIPQETTASDYYFSILFTSAIPQDQELKNKSDILGAVATNVLLSIGEETKSKVEIAEFSTPFFQSNGAPVKFKLKVSNLGEQFTTARGHILITNIFGKTIGRVDLVPTNILAGTSRYISSRGEISDAIWEDSFILGLYKATLNLQIGENGPLTKSTLYFTGAPIQLLTAGLIVASLLLLIKSKLKHHLKK